MPTVWWVVLGGLLILFVRKPDAFLNPQFWAEDGPVYFMAARLDGVHSLLRPYDGLFYLLQRSIAYLGNWVPVRYAPHFYNACALCANLGAIAFIARSQIAVAHRAALALATVLVPHSAEVWVNLTNLHWMLGLAMIALAASADPRSSLSGLLQAALLLIIALSGPFALLFLPIFAVRAVLRKSRWSWLLLAVVAVGAAVQLKCQLAHLRVERVGGSFDIHDPAWRHFWGNSLSGLLLLGTDFAAAPANNLYLVAFSVVFYAWLALYALFSRNRPSLVFLSATFLTLAAVAYTYRGHPSFVAYPLNYRYFYIPFVCTAWVLIIMLGQAGLWRLLAGLFLLLIFVSSLSLFRATPLKDLQWSERSRCIGGPEPCSIPINPEPWRIYYRPPGMATPSSDGAAAFTPGAYGERPQEKLVITPTHTRARLHYRQGFTL